MSDSRKKLLRAQYRKRKLEKDEKVKKTTSSLKLFFQSTPSTSTNSILDMELEEKKETDITSELCSSSLLAEKENFSLKLHEEVSNGPTVAVESGSDQEDKLKDPGLWPTILTGKIKMSLIEIGLVQLTDFNFPLDNNNRTFSANILEKNLVITK